MLLTVPDQPPLEGILRYAEEDHSFAFDVAAPDELRERSGDEGLTSLSIGTIQVEIGVATGLVLFAWGLHPRTSWALRAGREPTLTIGGARVEVSEPLRRGVSLPLAAVGEWATTFDEETGWVRVAKKPDVASEKDLLVASGVALGITSGVLDSLWLQPIFE